MEASKIEQLQQDAERKARDPGDGLDSFVRLRRVLQITDSSKSTVWRWIKAGKFPRPCYSEGNTVLWSLSELRRWQQEKMMRSAHV